MTTGIDVARYQGHPDWRRVRAAGIEFAYIKGCEGIGGSYVTAQSHWEGANGAGLATGLYHYAKPNHSAEANADAFSRQVNHFGATAGHLPPCLDLEEGHGHLGDWARRFVHRLRERCGISRVMVYSGASFFRTQIGEGWMDDDMMVWIAHYGRPQGKPGYLTPRVVLHQYSSTGSVSGIHGHVDMNVTLRPLAEIMGEDMPLTPADLDAIAQRVQGAVWEESRLMPDGSLRARDLLERLAGLSPDSIAERIWNSQLMPDGSENARWLIERLPAIHAELQKIRETVGDSKVAATVDVEALAAQLAAVLPAAAVQQLAAKLTDHAEPQPTDGATPS